MRGALIDRGCVWVVQKFGALPPLPWRPDIGNGASVGPIRAACAVLVCASIWKPAPLPPVDLPAAPEAVWPVVRGVDAAPGKRVVPEPASLFVFGAGVVFLALARRVR